jgi:hypothetical protein
MTLPTGALDISEAAKRQTASGGVNRPIFRLTIINIPKTHARIDPQPTISYNLAENTTAVFKIGI